MMNLYLRGIAIMVFLSGFFLTVYSQDFEVKSFEQVVTDLTARSGETSRTAFDGHKCAVLKVQSTDRVVEVQGNVFGPLVQKGMETWVYLTDGTKNVKLMFENHFPLELTFDDYNYPKLTEQMVYIVRLEDAAPKNNTTDEITAPSIASNTPKEEILNEAVKAFNGGYYDKAFALFNYITDDAEAQFYMGYMYNLGKGTSKDFTEAVRWYRKSAEQGNAVAQCHLGKMYEDGQGVSQDYIEAVRWYRKSAEQDNDEGQYDLGRMYRFGKGVALDNSEAIRWFRDSAKQGNTDARNALEYLECFEELSKEKEKSNDEIFVAVEEPAEFPGGTAALTQWLQNNIRYPEYAQQNDIQGRIVVKFVVERDGSISGIKVVSSKCYRMESVTSKSGKKREVRVDLPNGDKDLEKEAVRVVKKMNEVKWKPGNNNGRPVRAYFTLPITFGLQNH